jgi:hypothetical protein
VIGAMRFRFAVLTTLVAAALLLPEEGRAQPAAALRLAYAPAVGDVARGVPMSDAMSSQLPLQLDLLWRSGRVSLGAYGSWGLGQVGGAACSGASCSASVLRAGVQGLWAFEPFGHARIVPWAGAGLGWEWASRRRERLGSRITSTWSGAELSLQGGAEWPVAGRFGVGPFVMLTTGRYSRESVDTPVESGSAGIGERAVHLWIHVGVRGRVEF